MLECKWGLVEGGNPKKRREPQRGKSHHVHQTPFKSLELLNTQRAGIQVAQNKTIAS
jgi:hypothetical protein